MKSDKDTTSPQRKKWGLLPTLDMYVLREFMIPFSVLLFAFILLFIVGDIFNDLQDFLGAKSSFRTIFKYFMLKLPGNIRFILPITLLLSCMYTMANFGKNMEVTAMRATGISLIRSGGSIYFIAFLVTLINFWFNEQLVPECEQTAYTLRKTARDPSYKRRSQSLLQYRSQNGKRTWLFNYSDSNNTLKKIIFKQFKMKEGKKVIEFDIQADNADYKKGRGWEFRGNVIITPYAWGGLLPATSLKLKTLNKNIIVSDKVSSVFKKLPRIIKNISEKPNDIMSFVNPPEYVNSWNIYKLLGSIKDMSQRCKSLYTSILVHRMFFPWTCLLAVFLGVPLATKNERSGIFGAIIVAVVVVVVYQLLSNVGLMLGKKGTINPIIAGAAPTLAFFAYGWYTVIWQNK